MPKDKIAEIQLVRDSTQPFLQGRVLDGFDIVGGGDAAVANPKPGDPTQIERHGTHPRTKRLASPPCSRALSRRAGGSSGRRCRSGSRASRAGRGSRQ